MRLLQDWEHSRRLKRKNCGRTSRIKLNAFILFAEVNPISKFAAQHSSHPLVEDVNEKAAMFDRYSSAFSIPPAAATVSV